MNIDYRYEIKFVLDEDKLSQVVNWLHSETTFVKKYKDRNINSLYFDDMELTSATDNLIGIQNREKIRLRWYDNVEKPPILEKKVRDNRLGYKELVRTNITPDDIKNLNLKKLTKMCDNELTKHHIFLDQKIYPTLQVYYERQYFQNLNGIRITLDQNIRFYNAHPHHTLFSKLSTRYNSAVMEIKFKRDAKNTVADLIRPLHITPKRNSKYLTGLAMLGKLMYI